MRYFSRRAVLLLIVLGTDHTDRQTDKHTDHTQLQYTIRLTADSLLSCLQTDSHNITNSYLYRMLAIARCRLLLVC